jgi:hypothetical protein
VLDEAKRQITVATGLPAEHIIVSGTHTHSSVSARWGNPFRPGKEFSEYQSFLAHRIADGVRCALYNLRPAKIAWGTADLPGQVFCRRWLLQPGAKLFNPFGEPEQVKMNPGRRPDLLKPSSPVDPQIVFFALQTLDGQPMGLLANYSLHYVGGTGPNHISADYFAMFADRIQELLGADRLDPPFVAAMSNGTSGNVNNINYAAPREPRKPYERMRQVADECAKPSGNSTRRWCGMSGCRWDAATRVDPRRAQTHSRPACPRRMVLADPQRPDNFPTNATTPIKHPPTGVARHRPSDPANPAHWRAGNYGHSF